MSFIKKCKHIFNKITDNAMLPLGAKDADIAKRIDRLERNYIILLKRVLEIDGAQFVAKHASFTTKVVATTSDEFNKGVNEPEPTIH